MLAGGALVLGSLVALLLFDPPNAKQTQNQKEKSHVPVSARC